MTTDKNLDFTAALDDEATLEAATEEFTEATTNDEDLNEESSNEEFTEATTNDEDLNEESSTEELEDRFNQDYYEACTATDQLCQEARANKKAAQELKQLVEGLQQNDPVATEALCLKFLPLIKARAGVYREYALFSDEAEACAWEILLRLLRNYRGDRFDTLPGLINTVIWRRLANCSKRFCYRDPYIDYETPFSERELYLASSQEEVEEKRDFLEHLDCLTDRERKIIDAIYIQDQTAVATSTLLQMPLPTVRKYLYLARAKLKELYSSELSN